MRPSRGFMAASRRWLLALALLLAMWNLYSLRYIISFPQAQDRREPGPFSAVTLRADRPSRVDAPSAVEQAGGSGHQRSTPGTEAGRAGEHESQPLARTPTPFNVTSYAYVDDTRRRETIPVVVVTCSRPQYLRRTLERLVRVLEKLPSRGDLERAGGSSFGEESVFIERFPIIISRDCDHAELGNVAAEYVQKYTANCARGLGLCVRLWRQPNRRKVQSYAGIARHFGFILHRAFGTVVGSAADDKERALDYFEQVILLEEDLEIAPDFFHYFAALLPLLRDREENLLAASAWADNGNAEFVSDPRVLQRTDFFPGLGWMLTRETWLSDDRNFARNWPESFWDDWLRDPPRRLGRACIRPEVSRTYTFGEKGVSAGQFFNTHLSKIQLNTEPVDWMHDLDAQKVIQGLRKHQFDISFLEEVRRAIVLPAWHDVQRFVRQRDADNSLSMELAMTYSTLAEFTKIAKTMGIMDDEKAGVPRTAYHGVVTVRQGPHKVFVFNPELLPKREDGQWW